MARTNVKMNVRPTQYSSPRDDSSKNHCIPYNNSLTYNSSPSMIQIVIEDSNTLNNAHYYNYSGKVNINFSIEINEIIRDFIKTIHASQSRTKNTELLNILLITQINNALMQLNNYVSNYV